MVLGQPVKRVVDEKSPYAVTIWTVEIYRLTPWRSIAVGKERSIFAEVVSLGHKWL